MMRIKMIAAGLALAVLGAEGLFGQPSTGSSPGLEFPVIMRQKVEAGATPVGTKVEARLTLATLVDHAVIPQDAVLSGEVTESVEKSAKGPSRLGIRMDSAQWKNGSVPIKVYLTAWFYPLVRRVPKDLSDDENSGPLAAGANRRNRSARSYPGWDPDTNPSGAQPTPASGTSGPHILLKDVEAKRES